MSTDIMYEGTEYISKALCYISGNKFYKYEDREYKIDISASNSRNVSRGTWLKITKIIGKNKKL